MRFQGKVAAVTGVTSGVGRATAKLFAAEGAAVVGIGRREELGKELEREIGDAGGTFTFVAGSVAEAADCKRLVDTAVTAHGSIDIVVNNAGTTGPRHFASSHTVTEEEWDEVVETNLRGTFFCCRYALEHMTEQRSGVIVNVSSNNAVKPTPGMAAYCASKAAILQLSRTLAVEYYRHNVRVTAVTLGGVDTPLAQVGASALTRLQGAEITEPVPLEGMVLSPEEVARGIALICEPDAAVYFAAVVPIDGGITALSEAGGAYGGVDIAGALNP